MTNAEIGRIIEALLTDRADLMRDCVAALYPVELPEAVSPATCRLILLTKMLAMVALDPERGAYVINRAAAIREHLLHRDYVLALEGLDRLIEGT